ncbi:MAG: hypothetical protein IJZ85_04030 [Lachnospiraceae bacterium]|nr:hypothetical protein [Lachnospiraceae bacterium]
MMNVIDRISDLSMLWKQASTVFPYFDRRDLDWDETYREFLPRVIAAEEEREFHLLLAEFMNRLGDGHTDYLFPKQLIEENGFLPFALKFIDDRYYLQAIEKSGEEHLLAEVLSINGTNFRDLLAEAFRYIYHVGNYAYPNKLNQILPFLLNKTDNEMITDRGIYRFDLAETKPELVKCGELKASKAYEDMTEGRLDIRLYEGGILYARMDDCLYSGAADEIAEVLKRISGLKGVILDLRENIGGMTMFGAKVAELFISGIFHVCKKRTRLVRGIDVAVASQFGWNSKERTEKDTGYFDEYLNDFGGPDHRCSTECPCVILTSRNTISAAEDVVAIFLSSDHRATRIGTPTHGSTGTPMLLSLSCGGGARVCSVGYQLMDGTEFIGVGIVPDILMENRIEDVRAGRDRVLETAIGYLLAEGKALC